MGFIDADDDVNFRLKFEDPKYAGLDVTMRGMDTGGMLNLLALAGSVDVDVDRANLSPEQAKPLAELLNTVADNVVAWNVQRLHEGQVVDVPPTRDGVLSRKLPLIMAIVAAWTGAMSVSGPLDQPSPNGEPSPVESTLAALSSPNPPSLP